MHYMQNVAANHAANMYGYAPWGTPGQPYPPHPHAAYHHPQAAPPHNYAPPAGDPAQAGYYAANPALITQASHPMMQAATASTMPHSSSNASTTAPYFGHLQPHPGAATATAGQHPDSNRAATEVLGKLTDLAEQLVAAQGKGVNLRAIQQALTHQQQLASNMGLNGHPATLTAVQAQHRVSVPGAGAEESNGGHQHLHVPSSISHPSSHSTSPRPTDSQVTHPQMYQHPQVARPY